MKKGVEAVSFRNACDLSRLVTMLPVNTEVKGKLHDFCRHGLVLRKQSETALSSVLAWPVGCALFSPDLVGRWVDWPLSSRCPFPLK